jgi:hypothetical protein
MEYTPHKENGFLGAQAGCQADFTYSMSPDVIAITDLDLGNTITDLDLGNKSVTNDIENVLRKIEYWHQGPIKGYRIMYRDSEGIWDGVQWDGRRASFFALQETKEALARKKLLKGPPPMKHPPKPTRRRPRRRKPRLCPLCGYAVHYSHDERHRLIATCEACGHPEIVDPIPLLSA